jgi:formylmethanofuran dehydrogenase subunit C
MAALRFMLRAAPDQRVDLAALVPSRLAGIDRAAIERLPIATTRATLAVGDLFRVRGEDAESVVIEGGSARFDRIGEGMEGGTLRVEGDVGACAGRSMRGGRLEVGGSAGPFLGSGMRGGEIEVGRDAGDHLGGPLAGEVAGMAGGMVLVHGHAGVRAGDRLRRGVIVIEGDAGDAVGSRMIAGTLVVCGAAGMMAGTLMRRGTLVLGGPAALPPSFVEAGAPDPVFVRLLARALGGLSRPAARLLLRRGLARSTGDNATLGQGEILWPDSVA